MKSMQSKYDDKQRLAVMRAYMNETARICKRDYGGNWDKMPEYDKLSIDWSRVIKLSKISTTPAGASKIVAYVLGRDDLMNQLS